MLEELRARRQERAPPCLQCEQAGKHYFGELRILEVKW